MWENFGSYTFHPRPGGEGGYGINAFLTNKLFQRALEEMKAQNLASPEQWQILFQQAKNAMDDILQVDDILQALDA